MLVITVVVVAVAVVVVVVAIAVGLETYGESSFRVLHVVVGNDLVRGGGSPKFGHRAAQHRG